MTTARRAAILVLLLAFIGRADAASPIEALMRAYPNELAGFDGTNLIWREGTRMPVSDGRPDKSLDEMIRNGSILDQFHFPYPRGAPLLPPTGDPGRIRNRAFFDKMYGDCRAGEVTTKLVPVVWLPTTWGHTVMITSVNGVDQQLVAISRELDALPAEDKKYLYPVGGTYNCRSIADTGQISMHGWGAAIDINTGYADYWLWRAGRDGAVPPYRNRIPLAIVTIFEKHGFIWGGRWMHFDTMHFEYRPELLGEGPPFD